jgi:hypothetical protein
MGHVRDLLGGVGGVLHGVTGALVAPLPRMSFVWISKRSGQRARGGGCIGCIPFGCLPLLLLAAALTAALIP